MKLVLTLLLLVATPAALANSVTICKDDKLLISSDSVHIISKNHETVKLSHNCDLNISPDSKVVVKNNGRRIVEDRSIVIEVDDKRNSCEVQQIV
jgi:hypothetical protein